jgi:hypothetical protein
MKLKIQALGIVMVLFGSPIIHFFRDFVGVLPKSPLIMPVFSVVFFAMIFSFSHLKKIYKPNFNISVTAWCFLGYSMFMAIITDIPIKTGVEAFNYFFLALYFFLICGVNIKVSKVIIPIVILVVLFDNFALIVAFIRNPFTQIGQRAIISDVGWGEGAGNPSLYSFMAFTGLIASLLIYNKAKLIWKIIAIGTMLSSVAVILMTLIRATIFTLVLCLIFYLIMNRKEIFKKSKIDRWYNYGFEKTNFILFSLIVVTGLVILVVIDKKLLANLFTYVESSYKVVSHVIETLTAGNDKKSAMIDPSAANRLNTFGYAVSMLNEEPLKIIYGFGYRFMYVDIPLMQILLEEGLIGLVLILMFHYYVSKNVILAGQIANNKWILLLVYYYILLLMNSVSRGQPYDPYFWNYFLTIARFMKPEYMVLTEKENNLELEMQE